MPVHGGAVLIQVLVERDARLETADDEGIYSPMSEPKFAVGAHVRYLPDASQDRASAGLFKIVRQMPAERNVYSYHIQNEAGQERIARENQLEEARNRSTSNLFDVLSVRLALAFIHHGIEGKPIALPHVINPRRLKCSYV
jgi:hypothetical protein